MSNYIEIQCWIRSLGSVPIWFPDPHIYTEIIVYLWIEILYLF
jgi:hypothetical protein